MATYFPRPLLDAIRRTASDPVVILEGPRAVGKTTGLKEQLVKAHGFNYVTLADSAERDRAERDTRGWLRRLPLPSIVDEAQLVPSLILEVKELVDELGSGPHILLSGSASLRLEGLGGQNPLAGRSQAFTMFPLTRWELARQAGSIVDALFDGEPRPGDLPHDDDPTLIREFELGGFPRLRAEMLPGTRDLTARVRDGLRSRLSAPDDPDLRFNAIAAQDILDRLLRTPGAIFNGSKISQVSNLDVRTIQRYLDIFLRLFLVRSLPNLATAPSRQPFARSKIHPIDTSFSFNSLSRAGVDVAKSREHYGALLESYVVHNVLASKEWARTYAHAYYWREAKTEREVDLVLRDGADRYVGIEVKSAVGVTSSDLQGLHALQRSRGLHRGYLFYRGTQVRQLDEDIWALPIESLGEASVFEGDWQSSDTPPSASESWRELELSDASAPSTSRVDPMPDTPEGTDATIFLSYVHADDQRAEGRIVKMAHDIVDTYEYLTGRKLKLFIDRDSIVWGENWRARLNAEIERTVFLLPVVTPRFLKSVACREEVIHFTTSLERSEAKKLLLPLVWVDVKDTDIVPDTDPVLTKLRDAQFIDVTGLRTGSVTGAAYEERLEQIAMRLRDSVQLREGMGATGGLRAAPDGPEEGDDLVTALEKFQERQPEFEQAFARFGDAFTELDQAFAAAEPPSGASTGAMQHALANLGERLSKPVDTLSSATEAFAKAWSDIEDTLGRATRLSSGVLAAETSADLRTTLDDLIRSIDSVALDDMRDQARMMGNVSRHLRPLSRALDSAVRVISGIRTSVVTMRSHL